MTLEEAKTRWNVSYEQLCKWLDMGIIQDTGVENGAVVIHGAKPLIPKNRAKITVENVRKYILKACNEMQYIDYRILCIEPEQFRAILLQLEESNYVQNNSMNSDYLSNKHFIITEQGGIVLNKGKFKLNKIGFEIGFSYNGLTAGINGEFERNT